MLFSDLTHVVQSAVWFWRYCSAWGDINIAVNKNDFLKVIIYVNGGYNHVYERNLVLYKLSKLVNCDNG